MPAGRAVRRVLLSPPPGYIFGALGPSACGRGLPVPPAAQRGALLPVWKARPCLFCLDTCGCGLYPLCPPLPAASDLPVVALGERRWHSESSGGCAALPHGPWGPTRRHGHCHSEGKNHIFSSIPPSPFPVWSFFRAKGKKRTWPVFPASLGSCSFIPLFPAAANGFARERSQCPSLRVFFLYCLSIGAGWLW